MKAAALFLGGMVAVAACGRSESWAEGDSTAFPLTTPGTPVKVEREVIRVPDIAVGAPGEELLSERPPDSPPAVESAPSPRPPATPPEPPPPPRDTGQALLL